jgi:hypothetical protein
MVGVLTRVVVALLFMLPLFSLTFSKHYGHDVLLSPRVF